jgi:4-alpha-glucanotransferase
LGSVPSSVRTTLAELGICGTKVIRWERRYEQDGSFIPFSDYPKLSLTTVSTHDSDTLQLWWQNSPDEAKAFCAFLGWNYSPDLSFDQRLKLLNDAHHTPSIFHINLLQEYLALFPELVSANPQDERINVPGKVLPANWTYRFRPSIEEIAAHLPLKKAIASVLE